MRAGPALAVHIDGMKQPFKGTVRYVAGEASFTPYYALTQRDRSRLAYLAEIDLPSRRRSTCRPACRSRCAGPRRRAVNAAARRAPIAVRTSRHAIEAHGLTEFGAVVAVDDVDLEFRARRSTASSARTAPASRRRSACCAGCSTRRSGTVQRARPRGAARRRDAAPQLGYMTQRFSL